MSKIGQNAVKSVQESLSSPSKSSSFHLEFIVSVPHEDYLFLASYY